MCEVGVGKYLSFIELFHDVDLFIFGGYLHCLSHRVFDTVCNLEFSIPFPHVNSVSKFPNPV